MWAGVLPPWSRVGREGLDEVAETGEDDGGELLRQRGAGSELYLVTTTLRTMTADGSRLTADRSRTK